MKIWSSTTLRTHRCALSQPKVSVLPLTTFQSTQLPLRDDFGVLSRDICRNLNLREYIETIIKAASRNLGVLNWVRRFFAPEHLCLLYKIKVRSCVKYWSHLCDGTTQYLFNALEGLRRQVVRIINSPYATKSLLLLPCTQSVHYT